MLSRLPWRVWCVSFVFLILLGVLINWVKWEGYWITYQATPSMPQGWYWVTPVNFPLKRHEVVVFQPPLPTKKFLVHHQWLPHSGYMMKYVIGIPGDSACNLNGVIQLNHRSLGSVKRRTPHKNIQLPLTHFCGVIPPHHYLLMNPGLDDSYDGRYFGPVSQSTIQGTARPIWTRSAQ